ncbi:CLUMA_CG015126, isoform A [Clunio marinus]|uniref:protein-serine/threonine phosphatase n=1 Tax=Clunio marinus TaxID=568069 RepID=A0A1J1ISW8_9DIPT|nr:CLUMA_CG015126, isoform A [Clunio marinus]
MGQTLSEPVTNKETAICQDDFYKVGSSCMQGWRTSMEDSHTHILSLPDDPGTSWFSVFDGHGGSIVAKYASKHLHKFVIQRPEFPNDIPEALKQGFLECDTAMYNDVAIKEQMAGSTAITVLIRDNKIYCANAGDSRAIGSRNGTLVALSSDHKPNNPEEMDRIFNAGGWVEFNRVNGNLALSRALGDFLFKRNQTIPAEKQIVTAYPEVSVHDLTEEWDFLVLACDGIWDVLTNQAVINFVTEMIGEGKYPESICEELLGYCLAPVCHMGGLGGDNMSIIIVCLLHGKPWENLVEKCKKIHSNKRASTKLSDPAFTNFDRFTAEGPFAEVSVLKAADDIHNSKDSVSSSSHTSSSSSSPISTDEKFETMVLGPDNSEDNSKETAATTIEQFGGEKRVEENVVKSENESTELKEITKNEADEESKAKVNNDLDNGETSSTTSDAPKASIVSNGE